MSEPYYADKSVTLWHGDCVDVLRELPDASVDAVVTDPPYNLSFMGKAWDSFAGEIKQNSNYRAPGRNTGSSHDPNGSNGYLTGRGTTIAESSASNPAFQAWCEQWATECLRVLKPGGHLLAFGGTRTFHRLTCAIEDAGFEIRDSISWLYGSGFPKSLDVSKAIDKLNGRHMSLRYELARHIRAKREAAAVTRTELSAAFPQYREVTANWERTDENGNRVPTPTDWAILAPWLDLDPSWLPLIERIEAEREVVGSRTDVATRIYDGGAGPRLPDRIDVTAPATDDARTWQGWGTALKPGWEPIVVARKPLVGTVAANVLAHGTGALNIDATRIGEGGQLKWAQPRDMGYHGGSDAGGVEATVNTAGRWPANVILDEHAAAELDQQSGESTSKAATVARPLQRQDNEVYGKGLGSIDPSNTHTDSGGASRFFYTAKADAGERVRVDGVAHPTVKPLSLMRWLVRLVTPPGGTVLEPFAGSGTTVEACILEGFRCVAIEREPTYLPLIVQRINRQRDPIAYTAAAGEDLGLFDFDGEATA